jgi:hypothetical protein
MRLCHRPATASDLRTYIKHLTVSDRYGDLFGRLADVWCGLLQRELVTASVVEDLDRDKQDSVRGLGLSTFLTDAFTRHAKTPPLFWIGPELIRRMERNDSPILDFFKIRAANSGDGLNVFVWEVDVRSAADQEYLAVAVELGKGFFECCAGFNIKQVMGQHPWGRPFRTAAGGGGWLVNNQSGEYAAPDDLDAVERAGRPFLFGLTRELAYTLPGNWLATLFNYTPPRVFFTRAEQRLLNVALTGHTDQEIADVLAVSLSAAKRCWESVYARVSLRLAGLLPEDGFGLSPVGGRGAEKKRRLLSYLRDHPEELRPALPRP